MSDEKEFVDGLFVNAPREGAPDFVKAKISIKRVELGKWLQQKEGEWINLDVKVAKSGKWYSEVDNWKPKGQTDTNPSNNNAFNDVFEDDSPF